jgi:hypothetical protein
MSGFAISTLDNGRASWRAVASEADLLAGEVYAHAPPAPTMADAAAALTVAVQYWLDATAGQNGYDSLASCISYKDSSIAQWAADAAAALSWRDAVWQAAFQWQQGAVANPPATFPTSTEVIASLPQAVDYGWVVHEPGAATALLVGSN